MINITNQQFSDMLKRAIDSIPPAYGKKIANVAFVLEDSPSEEQRASVNLGSHQTLFGLYQGIPLTKRGSGYNLVLPDKITIFRQPIMQASSDIIEAQHIISKTVWHEVAHYFGLDHEQINKLER